MRVSSRNRRRLGLFSGPALACAFAITGLAPASLAQAPVAFMDDSVAARESIPKARELAEAGNVGEAVRVLQALLDADAEQLLEVEPTSDLFIPVREHVHNVLLASPPLLERYRSSEGPTALKALDAGGLQEVERSRFMTRAGLTAALRLAQLDLESARLDAALITLTRVTRHPDRTKDPAAAKECAELAALLAQLLDRDDAKSLAARFAEDATKLGAPPRATSAAKLPAPSVSHGPADPGPAIDAGTIPPRALQEVAIREEPEPQEDDEFAAPARNAVNIPVVFPTALDDSIFVNDGKRIGAFDANTLALRWLVEPGAIDIPQAPSEDDFLRYQWGSTRGPEDAAHVIAAGPPHARVVVATTGLAQRAGRTGDRRTHAIDAATGKVLWSFDIATLDRVLQDASVRGNPLVDADTVVLTARRVGTARGNSVVCLGLDLYSGRLKWSRSLATIGRLPWGVIQRRPDGNLLHRGIVYRADEIGVVTAIEASTGRFVWARRMPPNRVFDRRRMIQPPENTPAFATAIPALIANSLFVQEPGTNADILQLDAANGELVARRNASALLSPDYLVPVGEFLAGVGSSRVALVRASEFESGVIHLSPSFAESTPGPNGAPIVGRCTVAGGSLLIPLSTELVVLDPAKAQDPTRIELHGGGNLLSTGKRLIAADANNLRSFIEWPEARDLLRAHVARDPNAVGDMLTFVELALRAGEPAEAATMAGAALDALELQPATLAPGSTPDRRRLFDILFSFIVRQTSPAAAATSNADPSTPAVATKDARTATPPPDPSPIDPKSLDRLLAAAERAADTPPARAAYYLHLALVRAARHDGARAVEAYQAIFADPAVASAFPLPAARIAPGRSTGEEALERLIELLSREGPNLYAAFDDEAARGARALPGDAKPRELIALARRYPFSRSAPELYRRAAEIHFAAGERAASLAALGQALLAAETLLDAGASDQSPIVGRLGHLMVTRLRDEGRVSAAYRLLRRLSLRLPTTPLLGPADAPVDPAPLLSALTSQLAASPGLPFVGREAPFGEGASPPQILAGWRIAPALFPPSTGAPTDAIALSDPLAGQFGLFILRAEDARLVAAWTRPVESQSPTMLRIDLDASYLFWPSASGGSVEAIDSTSGRTLWKTPEFAAIFADGNRPGPDRFSIPVMGEVRAGELIVALDDKTLTLIERGGRAAAFDLIDGTRLWSRQLPLTRVHDIANVDGSLVVGGLTDTGKVGDPFPPRALCLDARSGEQRHELRIPEHDANSSDQVRLLRAGPKGLVFVAMTERLVAFEAATGNLAWEQRDREARVAVAALTLDDHLFLLSDDRALSVFSTADGSLAPPQRDQLAKIDFPVRLARLDNHVVLSSAKGVQIFDATGAIVGSDLADEDGWLFPPAIARNTIVALDGPPMISIPALMSQRANDVPPTRLVFLSSDTAKLINQQAIVVYADPTDLALLDGKVVITVGPMTAVLDAPAPSR